MNSHDIGIVVIGRNEGRRLINCLKSVNVGTESVVYVDSGSTDGSVTAAEEMGISVVRLDVSQSFTAARARDEGFTTLMRLRPNIRFVQFIDGDCELVSGWLDNALAFLERRTDVAVLCGRRRERYPDASIYNRLCDIEWDTPVGNAAFCGGDSIIRSDAYKAVGGFRRQLIAGEEPELCLRLRDQGWKIWRLDAEMTRHDAAITRFAQWWVRAVRGGYACAEVASLHRRSKSRVFASMVRRAIFWAGLVPLGIGIGTWLHRAAITAILVYPIQVCSIALRRNATKSIWWIYGIFIMIAKFAEFQGILKYYLYRLSGNTATLIEYKRAD